MKGYFSKLTQHTGLNFDPGAKGVSHHPSKESTMEVWREGREEVAPLHVEAITPSDSASPDSRNPVTAGESFDNVAALMPGPSAEARDNFTTTESAQAESEAPARGELPAAGVRQIIQPNEVPLQESYREPLLERENFISEAPPLTPETLIEISPRASPEEPRIRFEYYDSSSNQPRVPPLEPSLEPRMVEFLEEESPVRQASGRTALVEEIAGLESHFAAPQSAERNDRNQAVQRPKADGQIPLQPFTEAARPASMLGPSEQETAIRTYMKEVRAWVAGVPMADERALEPDDWSGLRPETTNVFAFEPETDAASVPRHERAADMGVSDLSLSIGNISILIEEPKKDLPPPPATPPSAQSSPLQTASEPTSLSRYYLRPW